MNKSILLTGILFIVTFILLITGLYGVITILDWPGILKEPVSIVLSKYSKAFDIVPVYWFCLGFSAVFAIFPILFTYDLLQKEYKYSFSFTMSGVIGGLFSGLGFLRWIFAFSPLIKAGKSGVSHKMLEAAFLSIDGYAGNGLGEFIGQLFMGVWVAVFSYSLLRKKILPIWFPLTGIASGIAFALSPLEVLNNSAMPWLPYWGGFTTAGYITFIWILLLGIFMCIPKYNKRFIKRTIK